MNYKITYHPLAYKIDKQKLSRVTMKRISKAIENKLAKDPLRFGKPLQYSLKGYRSLRVGEFRVVFGMDEGQIYVIKIGHRSEVYDDAVKRIFR